MTIVTKLPAAMLLLLAGCSHATVGQTQPSGVTSQQRVDVIAADLLVKYQVVANRSKAPCKLADGTIGLEGNFCYEGQLALTSRSDIAGNDWQIYFSQTEPVQVVADGEFQIEHVNGDLHRLTPTAKFGGFAAGQTKKISFVVRGQVLTEAKLLPNYYVVAAGTQAKTIESTKLITDPETGLVKRPYIVPFSGKVDDVTHYRKGPDDRTKLTTPSTVFETNRALLRVSKDVVDQAILPTPLITDVDPKKRRLRIKSGIQLNLRNVDRKAIAPALERLAGFGMVEVAGGVALNVAINAKIASASGYELRVGEDGISVTGADDAGAAYGLYSLAALMVPGRKDFPYVKVVDAPRFDFRGMHIDVARNFHSKEFILKLIDQMAAYKLNKLHLHLADDEGWRLEIEGLPELTDIGSKRCHDPQENRCLQMQLGSGPGGYSPADGYFSKADYIEIVRAADARHIQVIPSLDMPGHSRAAVKSMEARYRRLKTNGDLAGAEQYLLSDPADTTVYESIQYYKDNTINACMESAYVFTAKVIDEVAALHKQAGQPLTKYHIGADETAGAWKESPRCKTYLANNKYGVTKVEQLGAHFVERVSALLAARNIIPAAWNDGLGHVDPQKMPALVQSNAWGVLAGGGATAAHKQANMGWDLVLSIPDALYFDFPHIVDPKEGGYYWATRQISTQKLFSFMPENLPAHAEFWLDANGKPYVDDDRAGAASGRMPLKQDVRFSGMQGHLWSETALTDQMAEYQIFPRLLALAERAWHRADWEVEYDHHGRLYSSETEYFTSEMRAKRDAEWSQFSAVLGRKELVKLSHAEIAYRLPTPGARIVDGLLEANIIISGLPVEYRDGGAWEPYEGKTAVSGPVQVRVVAPDGKRRGRAVTIEAN